MGARRVTDLAPVDHQHAGTVVIRGSARTRWSSVASDRVDQETIIQYVADTFAGVDIARPTEGPGAGDTFFIYDPRHDLEPQRQVPFATIVTRDYGDFDKSSKLDRPGVFRLNIGVSRETFRQRLGDASATTEYDFAILDRLMPHPVYGRQWWLCTLNPSATTFEEVKPLLAEAYGIAVTRFERRS
jgi:hypothetical protein